MEQTVQVNIVNIILLLIFINTLLEHLFNWGFRKSIDLGDEYSNGGSPAGFVMLIVFYISKTILLISLVSLFLEPQT